MSNIELKYLLAIFMIVFPGISSAQIVPYNSELIEKNYAEHIKAHRAKEEQSFRNQETTLLSKEFFPRFTGLNYFTADLKFRVIGKLVQASQPKKTNLIMSSGNPYGFVHYGYVSFFIDGKSTKLQVYEYPSAKKEAKSIFVPFTDGTTAEESYGGGRFIIINIPKTEQIVLDFNLAINPICVYDIEHACPVPPRSNRMEESVLAGAKMYYDPGS